MNNNNNKTNNINKPLRILTWNVGIGNGGCSMNAQWVKKLILGQRCDGCDRCDRCDVVFLQEVPLLNKAKKIKNGFIYYSSDDEFENLFTVSSGKSSSKIYKAYSAIRGDYAIVTLIRNTLIRNSMVVKDMRPISHNSNGPFGLIVSDQNRSYINVHLKAGHGPHDSFIRGFQIHLIYQQLWKFSRINTQSPYLQNHIIGGDFNESGTSNILKRMNVNCVTDDPTYVQIYNKNLELRSFDFIGSNQPVTHCKTPSSVVADVIVDLFQLYATGGHVHLPVLCEV